MRHILTGLLLCFGLNIANAQEVYTSSGRPANAHKKQQKKTGFDISKLVFGGGASLAFGDITDLGVSPMVGYRFTERFTAGVGLGYEYVKDKYGQILTDPTTGVENFYPVQKNIFYPSLWARYRFTRSLFVQGEFQYDFLSYKYYYYDQTGNNIINYSTHATAPVFLLGIGARMPITDRASVVLLLMYDVIQDPNSPYRNQIVFFPGVNIGF